MVMEEMLQGFRNKWVAAIDEVLGPEPSTTTSWEERGAIMHALEPIIGASNHALLPTGGGLDFKSVEVSREADCLDFGTGERGVERLKPVRLTLEYIDKDPAQSFFLLELGALEPLLAEDEKRREEFLDLGDKVVNRGAWDNGHLGYDEDDKEIPIPRTAVLVTRWLKGKILFVTKGSIYNGDPATYDGRHNNMSAEEIRAMIERSL